MEIKFIGQGLNPESDHTAGNIIIDSLNNVEYTFFKAFVAFVSTGGLKNILDQLTAFIERGGIVKLYVGVDLNATSAEALKKLLEMAIETYVIYSPNNIIYHPKIYTFEGDDAFRAIVGSSNLTESGLFQNIEAAISIDFTRGEEAGTELLAIIYSHFSLIMNGQHPSCQLLTREVLDILIENKVVLPEASVRGKINKIKREFEERNEISEIKLNQLFGKLKLKRPPKGYNKTVTTKDRKVGRALEEIQTVDQSTDLIAGAMWIETGRMTGGSGNQLDLSKTGRLDGIDKFGSVSFFGIDPFDFDQTKDIDIIFGGKKYRGNTIQYTPRNSNWRFLLKGRTDHGERLTTFTRPNFQNIGGFQQSILIFSRVAPDTYELEMVEESDLPKLIENSVDWARGGRSMNRAYGIIR